MTKPTPTYLVKTHHDQERYSSLEDAAEAYARNCREESFVLLYHEEYRTPEEHEEGVPYRLTLIQKYPDLSLKPKLHR